MDQIVPSQVACEHPEISLRDVFIEELVRTGRQCRECGFIMLSIGPHKRVTLEKDSRYSVYYRCEDCGTTFNDINEVESSCCRDFVPSYEWR